MIIRISALASGQILLNGAPADLDRLDAALLAAKDQNAIVWYYREAAAAEPPPQAMAVMQLIVKHKLPVSLSSKPDYSDYVDAKGASHPRDLDSLFTQVQKIAAGANETRGVVIVKPDAVIALLPQPPESLALKSAAAGVEKMIPASPPRTIAVLAATGAISGSLVEAAKSIPFLGMLMGFCYVGHAVWVFDPKMLQAGCRDADLLIVDGAVLPGLPDGWQDSVASVMRNANILAHDRATFQVRIVRTINPSSGRLEFTA